MLLRILTLLLVLVVAFPVALVRPTAPARATTSLETMADAPLEAAKKKKRRRPKSRTVTRTVRQTVTQTFTNSDVIDVAVVDPDGRSPANPYPTTIAVDGFVNGSIKDVNVILHRFTHGDPDNVDILLVASQQPARNIVVLSDVGGDTGVSQLTLTLDDQAAAPLPDGGPLVSGAYRPNNVGGNDVFFPAPQVSGHALLNVFNNENPNGEWRLYVEDDEEDSVGYIDGWTLEITAEADVQIEEQIPVKGKQRKGRR